MKGVLDKDDIILVVVFPCGHSIASIVTDFFDLCHESFWCHDSIVDFELVFPNAEQGSKFFEALFSHRFVKYEEYVGVPRLLVGFVHVVFVEYGILQPDVKFFVCFEMHFVGNTLAGFWHYLLWFWEPVYFVLVFKDLHLVQVEAVSLQVSKDGFHVEPWRAVGRHVVVSQDMYGGCYLFVFLFHSKPKAEQF